MENSINNVNSLLEPLKVYLDSSPESPKVLYVIKCLLEKDTSEKTKKALLSDLKCILSWYRKHTGFHFKFERLTPRDITDYKRYCTEERKYSVNTTNRKLINIRNFCKMGVVKGKLYRNHSEGIKLLPLQPLAPKSLTRQDLRRLLKEVEIRGNLRDLLIVEMLSMAGFRVSELANMKVYNLNITERLGSATVVNGKGGKTRQVPLNNEIRRLLKAYIEKYNLDHIDKLFVGQRGALTTIAFNKIIEFYAKKAGIKCHPHTLRHTFAYNYLEQNPADIVGLGQILGHSNLNTTAIYTQNRLEDLQNKVEGIQY